MRPTDVPPCITRTFFQKAIINMNKPAATYQYSVEHAAFVALYRWNSPRMSYITQVAAYEGQKVLDSYLNVSQEILGMKVREYLNQTGKSPRLKSKARHCTTTRADLTSFWC